MSGPLPALAGSQAPITPLAAALPELTERLADAAADVILLLSRDGVIRGANARAREVIGRNPAGMRLVDLFGVWAMAGFGDLVAAPPDKPAEIEAPLFTTAGEAVGFLWLVSGSGDSMTALSGREMTHVYPLDLLRRLSERVDALRDANRAKQDLLDMVAHEFKTPLTVIKGYAWLLAHNREDLPPEQAADAFTRIQQGADRLLALFDEVYLVSQIDSGRLTVHPAEFDLGAVVGEACRAVEVLAGGRGMAVSLPDRAVVFQDATKVGQVVINLLTNAIKYSPVDSEIRVAVEKRAERWEIRIFNSHEGLTRTEVDGLFERFSRFSRDEAVEGRGLGLYIARNLARKLEGDIRVESTAGVGVQFVFELPEFEPPRDA